MPTKIPREREGKLLRSIRVRLHHRFGIRLWRRNIGVMKRGNRIVRFGKKGQADLYGMLPRSHGNRHVELEVKTDGERPTPLQLDWLKMMHALGAVAWWTDNINDAERVAEAVMCGGRIVWNEKDFWVEIL
jgi:hypothetical protein